MIFLIYVGLRKIINHFQELFDLFIVFKHFPVLNIVWNQSSMSHLNVIFQFQNNRWYESRSSFGQRINLLILHSENRVNIKGRE
jgi:hypothetical protein